MQQLIGVVLLSIASLAAAVDECYEPCGCFTTDPPFDDRPLPEDYDTQEISWRLYTASNPNIGSNIHWDDIPSGYDSSKPTVYLIHGWTSSTSYQLRIKDAFLDSGKDYNIIVVDWSTGADKPLNYPLAASNTRVVGACTAHLAEVISGGNLASHHCMGHSLGGQTCGYMGKAAHGGGSPTLGRVTGLDPAGPLFLGGDPRVRLDKTDTLFMDNIHTNAKALGIGEEVGHVDFFPNKGMRQPGCSDGSCDHGICRDFVIASLTAPSCSFTARPCDSAEDADNGLCENCNPLTTCQKMGYYANTMPGRGKMFLRTVAEFPYCED
ncbi:hypothetical protein CAPTEDRAFT_222093 [Capitella teleta]|uniref:Lipase domain-containing protein n=1 Tax=Capitella teleta TaxID=283909 RepID=R7TQW9_CAPTE|nr:hypothetical protein CAPTEDRAFT_222093 [Capitella teleta]|eukprot:ELT93881.1 hypothetical protein CAPTEDRAFT_222093 [Capitella teleta]